MLESLASMSKLAVPWLAGECNAVPVQEEAAADGAASEEEGEDCSEAREHSGDRRAVGKEGEGDDENSGEPRNPCKCVMVAYLPS